LWVRTRIETSGWSFGCSARGWTGETGLEAGRLLVGAPEVAVVAGELHQGLRNAFAPACERLRNHHLRNGHRYPLQDAAVPGIARPDGEVGIDALQDLQRLDLVGFGVGMVHHSGTRDVAQLEAGAAQAPGQFHILAVHEDPGFEAADGAQRAGAQQHGSAAHPFGGLRHRVVVLGVLVWDLPHLPGRDLRDVRRGGGTKQIERARLRDRVLVQDQHVIGRADLEHFVDRGAKSGIAAVAGSQFQRQAAGGGLVIEGLQSRGDGRPTVVVPEHHAQARDLVRFTPQGSQTLRQLVEPGTVDHHQHINHCGPR
jgi:hypothetical protein